MIKGVNEYQFSELKKGSMVPQYLLKECVFVCGGGIRNTSQMRECNLIAPQTTAS